MSSSITDLREALFAALAGIKSGAMDLDKARAINDVAKTIVDTARVEVDYLRATGGTASEFLALPAPPPEPAVPGNGIVSITRHVLQG